MATQVPAPPSREEQLEKIHQILLRLEPLLDLAERHPLIRAGLQKLRRDNDAP